MVSTIQRAKQVGGSLMVRIPKDIVDIEHIQPGEMLEIDVKKICKDWFGAFKGLKPYDKTRDRAHSKYE